MEDKQDHAFAHVHNWLLYRSREHDMSRVVREPAFCICENKDTDQLRSNREAGRRLCFRYIDRTIPLLSKSKNFEPLAIFCGFAAPFVSDLVKNPEDRFSRNEAHIAFIDVSVLLSCIGKSRRDLHYVNLSILIKIH